MATQCAKQGCSGSGTKLCGGCSETGYCSAECQKEDWKVHKSLCVDIKKMPLTFTPMFQVSKYISKAVTNAGSLESGGKIKEASDLMQRLLAFLENQFGVPIEGTTKFKRSNGGMVDNMSLIQIRIEVSRFLNKVGDVDAELANSVQTRQLLESRNKSDKSTLLLLCQSESSLASSFTTLLQLNEAEYHCEQYLMFARLIQGDGQVYNEYQALILFAEVRGMQGQHPEARDLAEEAYILASGRHGAMHPDVQASVTQLIDQLTFNKEYSRADDLSRINYENLINPLNGFDQEGVDVARGMMQLANVWVHKSLVDDKEAAFALAEEAEQLARKAHSIVDKLFGESKESAVKCHTLCEVLVKRGKYTKETRHALEYSLALNRQKPLRLSSNIIAALQLLVQFQEQNSATMPLGDQRTHELQLRDEYLEEIAGLKVLNLAVNLTSMKV